MTGVADGGATVTTRAPVRVAKRGSDKRGAMLGPAGVSSPVALRGRLAVGVRARFRAGEQCHRHVLRSVRAWARTATECSLEVAR